MSKFVFVGGSGSSRGRRARFTPEQEADVCRLVSEGVSAKDAFAQVAANAGVELPPSYTKYASSLLWGLKKRVAKRCEKGDAVTLAAFKDLVKPVE